MKTKCPNCGFDVEIKRSLKGYEKFGANYFSENAKKSVAKRQANAGKKDIMEAARAKRWPKQTT